MKKLMCGLLIVLCGFCSCRQQQEDAVIFKTIDITYCNGWNQCTCVFIDSTKGVKVMINKQGHSLQYFKGFIKDSVFVKVNWFMKSVVMSKIDSVIGAPALDGGAIAISIKSDLGSKRSLVYGSHHHTMLDSLLFILVDLKNYKLNSTIDTGYVSESLKKVMPPPPLLETVKFVPPVIKEDQIDR